MTNYKIDNALIRTTKNINTSNPNRYHVALRKAEREG